MFLGQFDRAWAESAAIERRGAPDPHRFWDGKPLEGKRVMLRCLHGLGDTIQFIRYAPMIRESASHLIVEAHPELRRLLGHAPGMDEVVTWGVEGPETPPKWDTQIEVTELPRIFGANLETIPRNVPYLTLERREGSVGVRKRVGVVWSSSQWNLARCVPNQTVREALQDLPWDVYSLQHGPERNAFPTLRSSEGDVLDTAEDMLGLDLILSVDTMAAHLAGALALPVWVMLPFQADWRWMLGRSDTPWYPTMRLFRQPAPGDWASVLSDVQRAALAF